MDRRAAPLLSQLIILFLLLAATAAAQDAPGTVKYPAAKDSADSLIRASNNARTTLSVSISTGETTITVVSTASFPASGLAQVDNEIFSYTGKGATQFTGVVRGFDGTSAASHSSPAVVRGVISAAHHNTLAAGVVALENKLGPGASTPDAGKVLKGGSGGTSTWAALTVADLPAFDSSSIPSVLSDKTLYNPTINGGTQNAPTIINPTFTGGATFGGTVNATYFVGNCSGCTGITGATGGIANTGSTTGGADTDADGVGVFDLQTRLLTRLRLENNGFITENGPLDGTNLASVVAAIGTAQKTVRVATPQTVAAGFTAPQNVSFEFTDTGSISVNTGQQVTIQGPIPVAPARTLFSGAGTVSFAGNSSVRELLPQWFGAAADGKMATGCSITTGTAALTCTGAAFASTDVGKELTLFRLSTTGRGMTDANNWTVGGNAGAGGAPLVALINAVPSATQATLSVNASSTVSGHKAFYATLGDAAAIQKTLTAAETNGADVRFMGGDFYLTGSGSQVLLLNKSLRLRGYGGWSRLLFSANVPSTTDYLHVAPGGTYVPDGLGSEVWPFNQKNRGMVIEDLYMEPVAGISGRHAVYFDVASPAGPLGAYFNNVDVNRSFFGNTHGYSVAVDNPACTQGNGFATSTFTKNIFTSGFLAECIGDTIAMTDNIFRGPHYALDYSSTSGATQLNFERNNVTASLGIRIRSGIKGNIRGNIIELAVPNQAGVCGNGADLSAVNVEGSVRRVEEFTIADNIISSFAPCSLYPIRVNVARALSVEGVNRFDSVGKAFVKVVGTGTGTTVRSTNVYESGTLPVDKGTDTSVWVEVKPSVADVTRATAQTIATATETAVTWTAESRDEASFIDIVGDPTKFYNYGPTAIFSAWGGVRFAGTSGAGTQRSLLLRRCGDSSLAAPPTAMAPLGGGAGTDVHVNQAEFTLATGDCVRVFVYQDSGVSLDLSAGFSRFGIKRVAQ